MTFAAILEVLQVAWAQFFAARTDDSRRAFMQVLGLASVAVIVGATRVTSVVVDPVTSTEKHGAPPQPKVPKTYPPHWTETDREPVSDT
jgi:hypothetical protein